MNSINFFDHTIDIFSTFGIFLLGIFFIALFLISIAAGSTHGLSESILLLAKRFSGLKILPHRDYDGW